MINGPFTHSKILHKTIDATDCPECSHGERLYNERTVRILSPANPEPNPFHTSTLRAFSSSSQPVENLHLPGLGDPSCSPGQPFVYQRMQIQNAIRLMREVCALRHLSINTEKSYIHWLGRYGSFLKDPKLKSLTPEAKMEAFLTRLALSGVSASTQNQAFNALLFLSP
jgi:hypothetical protein